MVTNPTSLVTLQAENTNSITTTSATDVLMTGMTLTPAPGTYLVWFSTTLTSTSNNADIFVTINLVS